MGISQTLQLHVLIALSQGGDEEARRIKTDCVRCAKQPGKSIGARKIKMLQGATPGVPPLGRHGRERIAKCGLLACCAHPGDQGRRSMARFFRAAQKRFALSSSTSARPITRAGKGLGPEPSIPWRIRPREMCGMAEIHCGRRQPGALARIHAKVSKPPAGGGNARRHGPGVLPRWTQADWADFFKTSGKRTISGAAGKKSSGLPPAWSDGKGRYSRTMILEAVGPQLGASGGDVRGSTSDEKNERNVGRPGRLGPFAS